MSLVGFDASNHNEVDAVRVSQRPTGEVEQAMGQAGMKVVDMIVTDWGRGEVPIDTPDQAEGIIYVLGGKHPDHVAADTESALEAASEIGTVASPNKSLLADEKLKPEGRVRKAGRAAVRAVKTLLRNEDNELQEAPNN